MRALILYSSQVSTTFMILSESREKTQSFSESAWPHWYVTMDHALMLETMMESELQASSSRLEKSQALHYWTGVNLDSKATNLTQVLPLIFSLGSADQTTSLNMRQELSRWWLSIAVTSLSITLGSGELIMTSSAMLRNQWTLLTLDWLSTETTSKLTVLNLSILLKISFNGMERTGLQ